MKNRDKSICILLLGLSIYGLTKLYKKLKKNKSLDSKNYFSAGKYNEYILFYKDRKLDKKELINFVYACQMTSNYQLILEKSENFLKMNYSDDLLKNICKLRILSGLELLKDVSVFKEIILYSVLEKVSFYENENLILNELFRVHNKETQQIDLNRLSSLLSTFPELYKEFKSHPMANILLNKDYKNLLNFNDTGPTFRFLYAIINFIKTNDINYLLNLKNESFFYSKMFYEYVISKQTSFNPSQFQKENASTCFYKALIYRNQSNKSEYISWLNRAINHKESEFIFIELIKEKISQKNYEKALCICEKALKVFHTDTLLLLEIKILLLEKQIDLAKEKIKLVKNKEAEFYFVNSFLENRAACLKISYSLNKLSFLTNFNLGLVLLSENQIECLNYFLNCLSFSLDNSFYYKIFSLTVYLKEIKNLVEFLPNKSENFFKFLKERFCFEYLIFD